MRRTFAALPLAARLLAALLLAALLSAALLAAGCTRPTSSPPSPSGALGPAAPGPAQPNTPAPAAGPDLTRISTPADLPIDELVAGLTRYLGTDPTASPATRLGALYDRWQLDPGDGHARLLEADLDGDGQVELVTALNGSGGGFLGLGDLLVISRGQGGVRIDRTRLPDLPGARLYAVADLTGDGSPEIIWTTTSVGAHTAHSTVRVARWRPGRLESLPGEMVISFIRLSLDGRDLLLGGGNVGSAGAGLAQRSRTDRYRWSGTAFRLVDRRFAESPLGYHRLIDGIVAESFGRVGEAEAAYREAMEPGRPALADQMLPPEWVERHEKAVRTFARFRLGALLYGQGRVGDARTLLQAGGGPYAGLTAALAAASDRAAGCRAGEAWARGEGGEFLDALNAVLGYARPTWQPLDLCGELPGF